MPACALLVLVSILWLVFIHEYMTLAEMHVLVSSPSVCAPGVSELCQRIYKYLYCVRYRRPDAVAV